MINIAICDDERVEITYLTAIVRKWAAVRDIPAGVSGYESAERFLFAYEDNKNVDILLLDIQMKDMDGVELARRIRGENDAAEIIFITAFPDYAREGYEVSALHFLVKPVDADKLFAVLDKAWTNLNKPRKSILIETGGGSVRIPLADILYIETFSHIVDIVTSRGKFAARMSAAEFETIAGETFFRCHRSYVVNLRYVRRLGKTELTLDSGAVIPVSRRLYHALNLAFARYYKEGRV